MICAGRRRAAALRLGHLAELLVERHPREEVLDAPVDGQSRVLVGEGVGMPVVGRGGRRGPGGGCGHADEACADEGGGGEGREAARRLRYSDGTHAEPHLVGGGDRAEQCSAPAAPHGRERAVLPTLGRPAGIRVW